MAAQNRVANYVYLWRVRALQLAGLAWKADDKFREPRAIANFNHPRIFVIPETKVVLPFLNEHPSVGTGLPGTVQHFSFFVQERVALRPGVKIISDHAAPPSPLAQLATLGLVTHSNDVVRTASASRRAARATS